MNDVDELNFKRARTYKRGKKQSPIFETLKNWITSTFGFEVVSIEFDNKERPRLHIWFEKQQDTDRFYYDFENNKHIGFQIAEQYKILNESKPVDTHWLQKLKLYYTVIPKPEPLENLYCYYSCFSKEAIKEACKKVPLKDLDFLIQKYKKDKIWDIQFYDTHAYVFAYKHSDIEEVKTSIENELKGQWYGMLKIHDEFGYIDVDTVKIIFDSKENFDTNYQGQWHYYYR